MLSILCSHNLRVMINIKTERQILNELNKIRKLHKNIPDKLSLGYNGYMWGLMFALDKL